MFDHLAGDYFDELCRLDPVYATLAGRPGFAGALPDYSPAGWAARAELLSRTLARLGTASFSDTVLRERLAAELAFLDSGLASSLNLAVSPPMLIRTCLEQTDGVEARCALLRAVPKALAGYLRTLAAGDPPARRQAEVVLGAARAWGEGALLVDPQEDSPALREALAVAAAAYAEFADALERDVLPHADGRDGVGSVRYAIAARYLLGADVDIDDTEAWLTDRLETLRTEIEALAREIAPNETLPELCAHLDETLRIEGRARLRDWMREQLDRSFDIAARVLDLPEPLRHIEAVVPAAGVPGPIRYLPPAADGSRPGRVVWAPAEDANPVWNQPTMIHHEGVPGHHLQVGVAVLDDTLPLWQRHTTVYGHAEGWAVYAEGLMAELGALDAPARLGYLLGLRANAAVALADIGLHARAWTADHTVDFLRRHTMLGEGMLHFTVLRTAAWPGQALSYAYGERAWRTARATAERLQGKDFDPRAFHTRMLSAGPCGLSILGRLAARDAVRAQIFGGAA